MIVTRSSKRNRTLRLLSLMGLLLIGTVGSVRADFDTGHGALYRPNAYCYISMVFDNGQVYATFTYVTVTELYYADGHVQPLDTSDGSSYTVTYSTNSDLVVLTRYDSNEIPADQWISDAH